MSGKKEEKKDENEANKNNEDNLFGFGDSRFTSNRFQDYNPFMGGYNHFGNFGYGERLRGFNRI